MSTGTGARPLPRRRRRDHPPFAAWGELASALAAGSLIIAGLFLMTRSRLAAHRMSARAALVSIFFGQVFAFYRNQFLAIIGMTFSILAWVLLRFAIHEEELPRDVAHVTAVDKPTGRSPLPAWESALTRR
jgi:predicted neutral ceramidase superfamily lipid hydrolase